MRTFLIVLLLSAACGRIPRPIQNEIQRQVIRATFAVADELAETGFVYAQAKVVIHPKPAAFTLYSAQNEVQTYGSAGGAALLCYTTGKLDGLFGRIQQSGKSFENNRAFLDFLAQSKFEGLTYKKGADSLVIMTPANDRYDVESHFAANTFFKLYMAKQKNRSNMVRITEAIDVQTRQLLPVPHYVPANLPVVNTQLRPAPARTAQSRLFPAVSPAATPQLDFRFRPDSLHGRYPLGARPTLALVAIRDKCLVLQAVFHQLPPEAASAVLWTFNCNIKNENKRYAPGNYRQKVFSLHGNRTGYEILIPLAELPLNKNRQSGTLISATLGVFDRQKQLLQTSNGGLTIKIGTDEAGIAHLY